MAKRVLIFKTLFICPNLRQIIFKNFNHLDTISFYTFIEGNRLNDQKEIKNDRCANRIIR